MARHGNMSTDMHRGASVLPPHPGHEMTTPWPSLLGIHLIHRNHNSPKLSLSLISKQQMAKLYAVTYIRTWGNRVLIAQTPDKFGNLSKYFVRTYTETCSNDNLCAAVACPYT